MSELSELYISMSLKSLALSLVAIFIPVYLYELGYTLMEISLFYAIYFALRIPGHFIAGLLTARKGPKHVLSYSYGAQLLSLLVLLTLPNMGWPLWFVALVQSAYNSLFFVGFHVDFSIIENEKFAGKELSTMSILVRTAAALGPFVGGLSATLLGINATLVIAIVLLLIAIIPLMHTKELINRQERILYDFSLQDQWRNYVAYISETLSKQTPLLFWPLYLAAFVFAQDPYLKIGLVTSISILVSLSATRYFGQLIDNAKGRQLLHGSSLLHAVVHMLRSFANNLGMVSLVNISTELAESGQLLTMSKGFYGEADRAKSRIGYVVIAETIMAIARSLQWALVFVGFVFFSAKSVFIGIFLISALLSIGVLSERFKSL